jgi:Arc-like DNA binding domain
MEKCLNVASQPGEVALAADRSTVVQHKIRLRQKLLNELRRVAEKTDTSVNEEIERRLEASFEHEKWQEELRQDRDYFLQMFKLLLHVRPSTEDRKSILKGIEGIERGLRPIALRDGTRVSGTTKRSPP